MTTDEIKQALDKLSEIYSAKDALALQKQELIDSVLTPEIKAKLAEIDAEFAPMVEAVNAQASLLETTIKAEVITAGASVKGSYLHAVYAKGRVSWDSKRLEGLMIALPALKECRSESAPSVSLRKL